jgi:hypothetical protein
MRIRTHLQRGFLALFIGTLVIVVSSSEDLAWMFDRGSAEETAHAPYSPPRTPWGDPDLQGAYTNSDERGIPMERVVREPPSWFERVSQTVSRFAMRDDEPAVRLANQWEQSLDGPPKHSRAWLVVDPPDGKIPPQRMGVSERWAAVATRLREVGVSTPWIPMGPLARCISRGMPNSMMPMISGNVYDITQAPGVIAIRYEMVNETRVIPLDGRPHVGGAFRLYMGDARGRFVGDALVVETTNFTDRTPFRGSSEQLRLIERFTPVSSSSVEWSVTVDDPATWTKPWTFAMTLTRSLERPLEFACHEGNYALRNMLMVLQSQ